MDADRIDPVIIGANTSALVKVLFGWVAEKNPQAFQRTRSGRETIQSVVMTAMQSCIAEA